MRIYLIRHGRQDSRLCNVDVELAKEGILQAKELAKRLMDYRIDAMYASDLLRSIQTADVLNTYLGNLNYRIRMELREIEFGELTGNSDEYNERVYGDFLRKRMEMKEDLRFPNGECGADVIHRVSKVLNEIIKSGKDRVVVVTHGGVIRSVVTHILSLPQERKLTFATTLENTGITELRYEPETNQYYLERFNDYAHLEGKEDLLRRNW